MTSLEELAMNGRTIDYKAIPMLRAGSELRVLELDNSGINDDSLALLGKLQTENKLHLVSLSIQKCPRLTNAAISSLRQAMPTCRIKTSS